MPGRLVVSDSEMWQSPAWTQRVVSVWRFGGGHRVRNHPLILAVLLYVRRPFYRVVLSTGNKGSLIYALLCRLTFQRQKQVIAQLYLDPPRGILKPVQDALMRFALRGMHGVIVTTRGEIRLVEERFGVPADRIRYVPFHTNVVEPVDLGCESGHVFAGGRNFRDYETLVEAVRGTDIDLVVVCGEDQLRSTSIPPNVRVFRELPYERYLQLMRESCAVVVPLNVDLVPSGQSSILEGMAYGKPVVTNDSVGTVDYVRDGVDGHLYRTGDVPHLREQLLHLVHDVDARRRMGHAAYESVIAQFTFDTHARAKYEAVIDLARPR